MTFSQPNDNSNAFFCATLRPASPLGDPDANNGFCPLSPGPLAFSSTVLIHSGYELGTYNTRLRALDPSQHELLCLDVNTTMLQPGAVNSVYGHAHIIFWSTVGLAIGYWVVVGIARLVAAWGRGSSRGGTGILAKFERGGFILASALSGERFASSPALMRFCTSIRVLSSGMQEVTSLLQVRLRCGTSSSIPSGVQRSRWSRSNGRCLPVRATLTPMRRGLLTDNSCADPLLSQTAWAMLSYS